MELGMNDHTRASMSEQRHLVQRLISGGIPAGKELDECREVVASDCDEKTKYAALFTLLRGALADPLVSIEDTREAVAILKALARGELEAGELL